MSGKEAELLNQNEQLKASFLSMQLEIEELKNEIKRLNELNYF